MREYERGRIRMNDETLFTHPWMGVLEPKVRDFLRQRGVLQPRTVPIDTVRAELEGLGYHVHDSVRAVMASMEGLHLRGLDHRHLKFDASAAADGIDGFCIPDVKRTLSDTACPVATSDFATFFVTADGGWWLLDEAWILYIRLKDFNDVIRLVCFGEQTVGTRVQLEGEQIPPAYRRDT
ncbi:hypothetical protein LXT21_02460 [Myxococcus sp. K38C18041901]|uniref:hypothetical protein n=1 Tax=Myxococcus guangdongensis TaxID=2906760 RepID=UPI0020A83522|nr:hypothetical protein [Myxococcus guangdongensis]MCP3057634.1 hypothetical protein [Myxococcus guangdongensis]